MTNDNDKDAFEKIELAGNHEERAIKLHEEALGDLEEYLREELELPDWYWIEVTGGWTTPIQVECGPDLSERDILKGRDETLIEKETMVFTLSEDESEFDANIVEAGTSKTQRDRIKNLKQLIASLEEEHEDGAPLEAILERASILGMDRLKAEHEVDKLKHKGEVYEPSEDHLRTT